MFCCLYVLYSPWEFTRQYFLYLFWVLDGVKICMVVLRQLFTLPFVFYSFCVSLYSQWKLCSMYMHMCGDEESPVGQPGPLACVLAGQLCQFLCTIVCYTALINWRTSPCHLVPCRATVYLHVWVPKRACLFNLCEGKRSHELKHYPKRVTAWQS